MAPMAMGDLWLNGRQGGRAARRRALVWSGEERERGSAWSSLRLELSWLEVPALGPALPGVALLPAPGPLLTCPSRPLCWDVATGQVKHVDMAVTR